ncbi:periplasmic heavy metal sensor [Desulfovibrio aminophilus]|nr:periplasmic heavy metal sensor [Desulfovibrio aminophilus]MCM0756649.1 periplasmic heavy metal sensor [Desulfovibrio aminophilus]
MSKRSVLAAATLAALLALSAVAFAGPGQGRGPGGGMGSLYAGLTPEKQAAVDKIFEKHHKKIFELREQYWAKDTELDALTASGKAEKADIESLVGEMSKIRQQLEQERQALAADLSKETGVKFGPGGGFGPGMGMGYGPGGCPGYGGCPGAGGCGAY